MCPMVLRKRTPEVDEALDRVLEGLMTHGFQLPYMAIEHARNRDALARALVEVAIGHQLRIRIDKDRDGEPGA